MNVQIVALEGYGVSSIKVGVMALALPILLLKKLYFQRVLLWGLAFWFFCFYITLLKGDMRFSTIGYMGMFILAFIAYYNFIYSGAFSLEYFIKILRRLILAYCLVLIMQQLSMLVGLRSIWFINLDNQHFLSLEKLPSLSIEPSHSARLLTAMMLGYLRSVEILGGHRLNIHQLFSKKYRVISVFFLWTMLTMGSGTAFIGLAILSLYFIHRQSVIYMAPALFLVFFIVQSLGEFTQLDRAVSVANATLTADIEVINATDGSAADRIMPIVNTFTRTDLFDRTTWIGKGTYSEEYQKMSWIYTDLKIGIVDQYGLLAFFLSLILVYKFMIRKFLSVETLIFLLLFGFSLNNFYYIWGAMLVFTTVRFFQIQNRENLTFQPEFKNQII